MMRSLVLDVHLRRVADHLLCLVRTWNTVSRCFTMTSCVSKPLNRSNGTEWQPSRTAVSEGCKRPRRMPRSTDLYDHALRTSESVCGRPNARLLLSGLRPPSRILIPCVCYSAGLSMCETIIIADELTVPGDPYSTPRRCQDFDFAEPHAERSTLLRQSIPDTVSTGCAFLLLVHALYPKVGVTSVSILSLQDHSWVHIDSYSSGAQLTICWVCWASTPPSMTP